MCGSHFKNVEISMFDFSSAAQIKFHIHITALNWEKKSKKKHFTFQFLENSRIIVISIFNEKKTTIYILSEYKKSDKEKPMHLKYDNL